MKSFVTTISMLWLSFTAFSQSVSFENISLQDALDKAKQEKKFVFIDAYATWCGPCKQMDQTTFKNKEVGTAMDNSFVSLKIDVERGEGVAIKDKYDIQGLPGYLFLDQDGFIVSRELGYKTKEEWLHIVAGTLENTKDNVGRLEAQYEHNKGDIAFLKVYLDKLSEAKATDYFEVVEQYLGMQTEMAPESKAMVDFLAKHNRVLVYGGKAECIINEQFGTIAWDKYVRKDIRTLFQAIPKSMMKQTLDYAIWKRDTSLVDLALSKGRALGMGQADDTRTKMMVQYYKGTGEKLPYRNIVIPIIHSFYTSLDVDALKETVVKMEIYLKENPNTGVARSHALIKSEQLRMLVVDFVNTAGLHEDGPMVMKWADRVYDILPGDLRNLAFYAKCQYTYGDKDKALDLMGSALRHPDAAKLKMYDGIAKDLEAMRMEKPIVL